MLSILELHQKLSKRLNTLVISRIDTLSRCKLPFYFSMENNPYSEHLIILITNYSLVNSYNN